MQIVEVSIQNIVSGVNPRHKGLRFLAKEFGDHLPKLTGFLMLLKSCRASGIRLDPLDDPPTTFVLVPWRAGRRGP